MSEYPPDAICAVDGCGHKRVAHGPGFGCFGCPPDGRDEHSFSPIVLAGGTTTPEDEKAAYKRAMRGEA